MNHQGQHEPRQDSGQTALGLVGTLFVFAAVVGSAHWLAPERVEPQWASGGYQAPVATAGPTDMGFGRQQYQMFCGSCHGMPGEARHAGLSGSDLFDGVSEQPMTRDYVRYTMEVGFLGRGMLPMLAALEPAQVEAILDYVMDAQPG
jgi:mono/diheme cytochrome c family protein